MRSTLDRRLARLLATAGIVAFAAWLTVRMAAFAAGDDAARDVDGIVPPTIVEGLVSCTSVVSSGVSDVHEGVTFNRGEIYAATAEVTDTRLEGAYSIFFNADNYKTPAPSSSLGAGTWRIVNEAGAWQGSYRVVGLPSDGSVRTSTTTMELRGEGGYAGWNVLWEVSFDNRACTWEVRGVIVEGELPPIPEPDLAR